MKTSKMGLIPEDALGGRGYRGRGYLYDLVKEGVIDSDTLVVMVCKWLTDDDVMEMLDANELSPRFITGEDCIVREND